VQSCHSSWQNRSFHDYRASRGAETAKSEWQLGHNEALEGAEHRLKQPGDLK
jgi:hypothetical protein